MLQIHLFGKFCVNDIAQSVNILEARKAQELFSYLLLHRNRPQPRENLVDVLWSQSTKDQAQKGLRQALWQLQTSLETPALGVADAILQVDAGWVQINPAVDLWLDVAMLEQAFAQTQGITGQALDGQSAQHLALAVQLYQGDLLEGCYEDWCLIERTRLQNIYLALLDKLVDYNEMQANYETALAYGQQILHYDCAREQTHRKLMKLYCLAGNRTGALRQYEACVAALFTELDVKPARRTEALYQAIKADQVEERPPNTLLTLPQRPTSTSLPALLEHLQQMSVALADLQRNVAEDIEIIETLLHSPPKVAPKE